MVVEVYSVDVFIPDAVPLVTVPLVGVQVDYHDLFPVVSGTQVVDDHGDVGVNAETSSIGRASVVESSRKVHSPAQLLSHTGCDDAPFGCSEHGVENSPSEEEGGKDEEWHLDVLADRDAVAKFKQVALAHGL